MLLLLLICLCSALPIRLVAQHSPLVTRTPLYVTSPLVMSQLLPLQRHLQKRVEKQKGQCDASREARGTRMQRRKRRLKCSSSRMRLCLRCCLPWRDDAAGFEFECAEVLLCCLDDHLRRSLHGEFFSPCMMERRKASRASSTEFEAQGIRGEVAAAERNGRSVRAERNRSVWRLALFLPILLELVWRQFRTSR